MAHWADPTGHALDCPCTICHKLDTAIWLIQRGSRYPRWITGVWREWVQQRAERDGVTLPDLEEPR